MKSELLDHQPVNDFYGLMQSRMSMGEARVPPMTPGTARLLFFFVAAFLIEQIARAAGGSLYSVILQFGPQFELHQILTHFFVSGQTLFGGLFQLLFYVMIIWGFGSEIERVWGTGRILQYFAIGLVGAVLLAAMVGLLLLKDVTLIGPGGGLAAFMLAYALLWPDREVLIFFVFPLKIKWLVLIIFVLILLTGPVYNILAYSGGGLAAAIYLWYHAKRGQLFHGGTTADFSTRSSSTGSTANREKTGQSLKERIESYKKKKRLKKKQSEIERRIVMKNEVDRLLEKISKEGMDSLSRKEKAFLDEASKEF